MKDRCGLFEGFVVLIVVLKVVCHVRPDLNSVISPDLQDLRKRWGAADIVRDLEHIKQDVKKITKLQDTGELTTNEALFYFLRMHDFDDNSKLDGHELIAAMNHATDHEGGDMPFDELEEIVDTFFAYDDNNDGFISYIELRKHLSPDENEP